MNFLSVPSAHNGLSVHGAPAPKPAEANTRAAAESPERLGRLGPGDPTVAALLRLVSAQRADASPLESDEFDGNEVVWTGEEVDELTDRLDESVREARRLRAQLDAAGSELQLLRERIRRLADALGACGSCCGEDSGCRDCQGLGRPGRTPPDERLFAEMVMPAVRIMRLCDRRAASAPGEPVELPRARERTVVNLYASALLDRGPRGR